MKIAVDINVSSIKCTRISPIPVLLLLRGQQHVGGHVTPVVSALDVVVVS